LERILLVEDDAGAQLLLRNRLQELGYEVVVASTGARGLLEARAGRFDLYLVDIGLGSGIDGYEVCRRLKAMPQIHGNPVVLISGQVRSQEELHRGYEAGCQAYLVKGDMTLVEDVVRAMLRIKSLKDELGLQNRLLEERNRHLQEERRRGADLEVALRETGTRASVFRDLAAGHPDGTLLVDVEGIVRMTDRGAQDIFGKDLEGKHLADLARGTGLEAFVRNVRTEPHEAYRFDLEWANGAVRSLSASVMPTVPQSVGESDQALKVVLLVDAAKRRVAGEILRLEDQGIPRRELGPLLEAARRTFHPSRIVGDSPAMVAHRAAVLAAAGSRASVLITGPPGTGKDLAARCIHYASHASGPFVPVDCSALAPRLLESEIFGHAKGAFSEAITDRPGLLQQAQEGTVYLDEVGELPLALQERLLTALREKRVRRLGSQQLEPVSVRVVAASRSDLEQRVEQGRFLPELLADLQEIRITTPTLTKGSVDIRPLTEHFLERFGKAKGLEMSSEAQWVLTEYDWPGNIGELEHCIEVACLQATGAEIDVSLFSAPLLELYKSLSAADAIPRPGARDARREVARVKTDPLAEKYATIDSAEGEPSLEAYEKKAILHALRETCGDKLAAARLLNIGKSTFYRKLKTHGLS